MSGGIKNTKLQLTTEMNKENETPKEPETPLALNGVVTSSADTDWNDKDNDWDDDDDVCDIDDEEDEFERAMDECGQMHGGGCMLAGTEFCDWECPFSRQMYINASRKRDAKGRFSK